VICQKPATPCMVMTVSQGLFHINYTEVNTLLHYPSP